MPSTPTRIDVNADVGEGFDVDDDILNLVSSANIACGFHAGDPSIMRATVRTAMARNLTIGAHVSYPDRAGFGRQRMDMPATDLTNLVSYQIAALSGLAAAEGTTVRYVKPHGALYNTAAIDTETALAVVRAASETDANLAIMCAAGSVLATEAKKAGITVITEAFADRAYLADGTLAPRSRPGSVIHDPDDVADRVARMVLDRTVESIDGATIPIDAQSICIHSDSPGAVVLAKAVVHRLANQLHLALINPLAWQHG